jgi:hypothetical protein
MLLGVTEAIRNENIAHPDENIQKLCNMHVTFMSFVDLKI